MNSGCNSHFRDAKKDATSVGFNSLLYELRSIKEDIESIEKMGLSEEAKTLATKDLEKQINDVKERMHNAIDGM